MQNLTIKSISLSILVACSFQSFSQGLFIERHKADINQCYENSMLTTISPHALDSRTQSCLKVLNDKLSKRDNQAIAAHNLAVIYYKAGDLLNAQRNFEESIRLKPGLISSYHLLAQVHCHQGHLQLAADSYEQLLAIDSSNLTAARNLQMLNAKLYTLAAKR